MLSGGDERELRPPHPFLGEGGGAVSYLKYLVKSQIRSVKTKHGMSFYGQHMRFEIYCTLILKSRVVVES